MLGQTETIWNEFSEHLRAFILKRVRDEEATADILQDVFIKIHSNAASLRHSEKLRAWIYQITRNAINDYYRRQKPMQELSEEIVALEPNETEALVELAKCVQPFLKKVPEPYRETLVLSELQGLTQKEVAQRQGISLSGAKSRVQRGRAKLKEMLVECCALEFDHRGSVAGYVPRKDDCQAC
ncbi:MAG: RNA polymerase sigma factor SigZ [Pyrinomonadaceae bacterium]|nr:RNA polymerase sigma factor SigZ [Pyrinomonadaceae bacterium]MDQ3253372.1 RNA polymerase sigma factor SigZ [Acidobacteriota bacterium]